MNNDETPFTTEFFDKEAKRRKQIPIAVFTIVAAHVVLFVGLLGAAGCKKEATASSNDQDNPAKKFAAAEYQAQSVQGQPAAPAAATPNGEAGEQPVQYGPLENVHVTEPEDHVAIARTSPTSAQRPVAEARVATARSPVPVPAVSATDTYVVKSGDSLDKIARRYGTTTQAIKASNNLKSNTIRIGQKLKITNNKARQA